MTDRLRGYRVGWYEEDGVAPITAETKLALRAAVKALEDAGLEPVEERPPAIQSGLRLWIELFSRASAEQMRKFYRGREAEAGPLVQRIIDGAMGREVGDARRKSACPEGTRCLRKELLEWLEAVPLIVTPVGSTPAFEHGANGSSSLANQ